MFSRNVKPGMFGLGIAPQKNFLTYSTQFVLMTSRLVPRNVVMVAIDMCGIRVPSQGSGYMKLCDIIEFI